MKIPAKNGEVQDRASATIRSLLGIVTVYVVLAAAWILCSDMVVARLVPDPAFRAIVGTAKGWVFVAVTAILLYLLIKRRLEALTAALQRGEEAERRSRHGNRLYAVLSSVNQAMVRKPGCEKLLQDLCRILVEVGGFRMAWIGTPDGEGWVVPEFMHGMTKEYLAGIRVSIRDIPEGRGPTGTALREGRPIVCNDIPTTPRMAPWRVKAEQIGFKAAGCFPVALPDGAVAGLTLYAAEHDFFTGDEVRLLTEISTDISFALEVIQTEELRLAAEQQLEKERNFLKTLIRTIPDLIWLKDPAGIYLACNPTFERFLGAAEAEIIGKNDYDFFDVELADFFRSNDQKAMAACQPSRNEEWLTFADDGHRVLLETIKTPMLDARGGLIGVLGIARDITAAHEATEALHRAKEEWERTFDAVPDLIAIMDTRHRLVRVNRAMAQRFGRRPQECVGLNCCSIVHGTETPPPSCPHSLTLADGRQHVIELHEERLGGDFIVSTTPLFDSAGVLTGSLHVARDITERKQHEAEREKSQRLESLGVLAGGIAHDFNNIITAVIGNISLARLRLGADHRAEERLAASEQALSRATELTRQLLTFSRGGEPVKGTVATERLVREVIAFTLHGSNCTASLDLPQGVWPLHADAGQIHQALNNILINATQAQPEGGTIIVRTANETIGTSAEQQLCPGRYVKITVADQGEGIPPEIIAKIFDPYFTTKSTGTGLGLAAVFSIVKRHGGTIGITSLPGEGTTVTILLPAAAELPSEAKAAPEKVRHLLPGQAVLVMDDEEMIREVATEMLRELGYTAVACADGAAAVALYREKRENGAPFSAVILDMTIPGGMGGKEAAVLIRDYDPEAVLIISTGYCIDSSGDMGDDALFRGMVAKPYTIQQLAGELARLTNCTDLQ